MPKPSVRLLRCLIFLLLSQLSFASAYNGRPKLVVVIIVDQFRGDYLERYHDQFVPGGFRMLMERGADFSECYYEYANTHTAPGHATLFTGAYSNGHGIISNDWWDPARKKFVTSVEDPTYQILGVENGGTGTSPRNLLASTIGDELKVATKGASRVFAISLKDRSSILPGGHAADGVYWWDKQTGKIVTSTYYTKQLPQWVAAFNAGNRNEKYLNLEWKDTNGKLYRTTAPGQKDIDGSALGFYDIVGRTPYSNDYEFEFARELIANEKLGQHETTDFLAISISSYDILGHKVGSDSPQLAAMTLALDRQLQEFFGYLGRQVGLANVWIALSADHGVAPMTDAAVAMRIPATHFDVGELSRQINAELSRSKPGDYIRGIKWAHIFLNEEAFAAAGMKEADAERAVGEAVLARHPEFRGYYGKAQLRAGNVPNDELGRKYLNSFSELPGWYVQLLPTPFVTAFSESKYRNDADHSMPYSYDAHVPLLFFGLPFKPGTYRAQTQPVDLAVTLTSLLGINKPTNAVGRVLIEALAPESPPQSEKVH
jgi:predicted AlkP superfamily pyrophosphatase or phosphodiesterase